MQNTSINPVAAAAKSENLKALKQDAPVLEQVNAEVAQAEQKVSSEAQKSGLAYRLECHFASLTPVEFPNKPTMIILNFANLKEVNVICTEKASGAVNYHVVTNMTLNKGTEQTPLTTEQESANTLINTLGGSIGKAASSYTKQVMDICRSWAELYACAIEQKVARAKALYSKWEKKNA